MFVDFWRYVCGVVPGLFDYFNSNIKKKKKKKSQPKKRADGEGTHSVTPIDQNTLGCVTKKKKKKKITSRPNALTSPLGHI